MFNFSRYNSEYNECVAKGICSMLPGISALQEVLYIILRQISYYLLKLKIIGENTQSEDKILITLLSANISGLAFGENQILRLVNSAYTNLQKIKIKYSNKCQEFGITKTDVKNLIKITPQMNLSDLILMGERVFHEKYKMFSSEKKNYTDLLNIIIKSVSSNLVRLLTYEPQKENYILEVLEGLNLLNRTNVSISKYRSAISNLVKTDNDILAELYKISTEKYGQIKKVTISYSTRKGKALLVSGSCLEDLKKILDYTAGKDIDIYTHDNLLTAHIFEEFSNYKNLKGQFGICQENCVLDFATFPGAIFLTKNSGINTDYLYRGRLFTTSEIQPQGALKIDNDNFQILLDSAINSKGFAKGQLRPEEIAGYNENELIEKFKILSEELHENRIDEIIILGSNKIQNETYEDIIKHMKSKTFILNFSNENIINRNALNINLGNSTYIINQVLELFFKYIPLNSKFLNIYFSRCDASSISNMIYLKEQGAQNVYITDCSTNTISPALKNFIHKEYNISK